MSNSWLDYPSTSNLFKQSYIKDFIDVSGDLYVRNHNINGISSDISMNGTVTCNSITITGAVTGINSDVQTELDAKQNVLTAGTGITIDAYNTISSSGGGGGGPVQNISVVTNSSVTQSLVFDGDTAFANGEPYYDSINNSNGRWGDGVKISNDGNTILIGMPLLDNPPGGNGNESGMVTYRRSGNTWNLLGQVVYAPDAGMSVGYRGGYEISRTGDYIGHTSYFPSPGKALIYKLVGNSWVQHGNVIEGHNTDYKYLGSTTIKISDTGNTVFINAGGQYPYLTYPSKITIWDLINNVWTLRGGLTHGVLSAHSYNNWNNRFTYQTNGYAFGQYHDMFDIANNGDTLLIGVRTSPGEALVIDWDGSKWVERSATTVLIGTQLRYAERVAIHKDGNMIAIFEHSVGVHVFKYENGDWSKIGSTITYGLTFGYRMLGISDDELYIAGMDGQIVGKTVIFKWNGTDWQIFGNVISGGRFMGDFASETLSFITGETWVSTANATYNNVPVYDTTVNVLNDTTIESDGIVNENLDVSGGDIIVSGSTVHSSDIRLKGDIEALSETLSVILKLSPELYDKKPNIHQSSGIFKRESGFIAQEIWYKIPELRHLIQFPDNNNSVRDMSYNRIIQEPNDLSNNELHDMSYNEITNEVNIYSEPKYEEYGWGTKPVGINYEGLIAYLVGAIQELKTKIEAQTAEINNLTE
jgi:hypothetical protein